MEPESFTEMDRRSFLTVLTCNRCGRANERDEVTGCHCGYPLPSRPFNPNAERRWDRINQRFVEWDAEKMDWIDPIVRERCMGVLLPA